VAPLI